MKQDKEEKGHLLVVDDDPASLGVLFEYLREAGFRIFIAEDGASALRRIRQFQPDIILLDVKLPDIDGFEVCCRLKEYYNDDIPVIFLSTMADTADKLRGLGLNAVDYITKPFHPEEVVSRVEKHLMIRNLRKRLEEQNAQLRQEVSGRRRAEDSVDLYHSLFENMSDGFAYHEIILDEDGKPDDYRFLEINGAFDKADRADKRPGDREDSYRTAPRDP